MIISMILAAIAPFGAWKSPITTDMIVKESLSFQEIGYDGKQLYYTELRPSEKGRVALVRQSADGKLTDLVPEMSIRNRVNEYGGATLTASNGKVFFTNDKDKSYYTLDAADKPVLLIKEVKKRFADATLSPDGSALIMVCEEHVTESNIVNTLVRLDLKTKKLTEVAAGHDFYASPRFSPDGKKCSFVAWDFPNMPWDGTTLWLCDIMKDGRLSTPKAIAGGAEESICQVQWSPDGNLYFASDKTGFWNLYRFNTNGQVQPLHQMEADFGIPAWTFGRPTYAFFPYKNGWGIACAYTIKGVDYLGILDPDEKKLQQLSLPFSYIQNLCYGKDRLYFFGASATLPISLISLDLKTSQFQILKESFKAEIDPNYISKPEEVTYPSEKTDTGYAFYYPPKNPQFKGKENEKPPLIVRAHGGPNGRAYPILTLEVIYWTSRGFGFVDVNYSGSSGYGRAYLQRLYGKWGILDVADCMSAAQKLVDQGKADSKRLIIKGGSAGGYTTLCAVTYHHLFSAGASYFGISDLVLLEEAIHKFESHYSERLIGPFPQDKKIYMERSPINYVDQIKVPVLLLQGKEDKVVPPDQSILIFEALKKKKVPTALLLFDGEQHGFRMASSIKKALDGELYFYSKVLKFPLAEPVEPIHIENLP